MLRTNILHNLRVDPLVLSHSLALSYYPRVWPLGWDESKQPYLSQILMPSNTLKVNLQILDLVYSNVEILPCTSLVLVPLLSSCSVDRD